MDRIGRLRQTGHLSRLLRDRELIVRSDGRLHYLRLSREWHITLAATGIGLGAYLLAATIGLIWLDRELRSAEARPASISTIWPAAWRKKISGLLRAGLSFPTTT